MRVIQGGNNYRTLGGSDRVLLETIALLERAGHEVIPFAAANSENLASPYEGYFPEAVDTGRPNPRHAFRYFYNRDAAKAIRRLLNDVGPVEVAHLHIYYGKLTTAILHELRRNAVPVVQSLHDFKLACPIYEMQRDGNICTECITGSTFNCVRYRCKKGSLALSAGMLTEFWLSRMLGDVRLVDRFICVANFQRDILIRAGVPPEKLVVLPNFADSSVFSPNAPDKSKGNYFLYFGRIERMKGLETLARAFRSTSKELVIAGAGGWEPELQQRISGAENIRYVGMLSGRDLWDTVSSAKAVIVPSECYELCPMTVLESKAAGTPVVGSRIGGIPELINDGEDGLLFAPGSAEELAEVVTQTPDARWRDFGQAARADVEARFSPASHLSKLEAIYAEVA